MKNRYEEEEQVRLEEFNLKCYYLSMLLLVVLAVFFACTPDVHFLIHHLDDPQAIIEYGRSSNY